MADLIKKIKIKKQDGTFTDYIPIGAEAQNISTNDGDSVQLKLNKKPYYYNSVADMKADIKLKAGDMAVTLGYYQSNDGGSAEYKIVNDNELIEDNGSVHDLDNGLKARLIVEDKINVKQYGAYGDNVHNDTVAIQNAFNNFKHIIIPKGNYNVGNLTITGTDIYLNAVDSTINYNGTDSCINIIALRNSTLKFGNINALKTNANCIDIQSTSASDYTQYLNIFFITMKANNKCINGINNTVGWVNEIRIHDGRFEGGNYGVYLTRCGGWRFYNIGFEGVTTGVYLDGTDKAIQSIYFIGCRYAESFTTLIETVSYVQYCSFNGSFLVSTSKFNFSNVTDHFIIDTPIYKGNVYSNKAYVQKGNILLEEDYLPFLQNTNGGKLLYQKDLNTILSPGTYSSNTSSMSGTVTNAPSELAGYTYTMYVLSQTGNIITDTEAWFTINQVIISEANIYIRRIRSSGDRNNLNITAWKKITSTDLT